MTRIRSPVTGRVRSPARGPRVPMTAEPEPLRVLEVPVGHLWRWAIRQIREAGIVDERTRLLIEDDPFVDNVHRRDGVRADGPPMPAAPLARIALHVLRSVLERG